MRTLHTRFEEHMTKKDSSVFDHKLSCKADFRLAILGRRREETSLRILEGFFIRKLKPEINRKEENWPALFILPTPRY